MFINLDWQITIGTFALALLESCEVHKSIDILADTCVIKLPGAAYGKAYRIEQQIKRGDKVTVKLGYNKDISPDDFRTEFEGYLLNISTDDGSLTINCEDELFLMRVKVSDKQFKSATIKDIAQYLVDQLGLQMEVSCDLGISYDKFVISNATAYDVLKKVQEETKANIYLKPGVLHIHPPYVEQHGEAVYSFQHNIESSDLKYIRQEDKKIEVVVRTTGPDGKRKEVRFGTTGGDLVSMDGHGMSQASMDQLAKDKYRVLMTDGYEGSVTGWLKPFVEPGASVTVNDEDYEFKNGTYYATAVTTSFSSSGAQRKVQLGIKVTGNG